MAQLKISGFTDIEANGVYTYIGLYEGYATYSGPNFHYIIYRTYGMPYTAGSAYFLTKLSKTGNSSTFEVAKYICYGTDLINGVWYGLQDSTSGELDATMADINTMSSSSMSSVSSVSDLSISSKTSESLSSMSSVSGGGGGIGSMIVGSTFVVG